MNRNLYTGNPSEEAGGFKDLKGNFEGLQLLIQTNGSLDVSFWHPGLEAFGGAETLESPGGSINCPSGRVKLDGNVSVSVTLFGSEPWKHR